MKPAIEIDLAGPGGNVFAVVSTATKALKETGNEEGAERILGEYHK